MLGGWSVILSTRSVPLGLPREPSALLGRSYWGSTNRLRLLITQQKQ